MDDATVELGFDLPAYESALERGRRSGGIVDMLLRQGPDAPDAADNEDPERQR